eukprot:TRINITY_DN17855_c0_g1_i1.p1 TRINITY_DN17855_c0_g1~~TRINITY_DN17855_c0_g1_i1.p1  ORF type:complete len:114 (+),score=2.35 TRINITY_DN17855_c0_g1_i1:92-433(+)
MNKIAIISFVIFICIGFVHARDYCYPAQAQVCADGYTSCINAGGSNTTLLCDCYQPYFSCLRGTGCAAEDYTAAYTAACHSYGVCAETQCSVSSATTTMISAGILLITLGLIL